MPGRPGVPFFMKIGIRSLPSFSPHNTIEKADVKNVKNINSRFIVHYFFYKIMHTTPINPKLPFGSDIMYIPNLVNVISKY